MKLECHQYIKEIIMVLEQTLGARHKLLSLSLISYLAVLSQTSQIYFLNSQ